MTRQRVFQGRPPDGLDLSDFPVVSPESPVYRAHSRNRGPWFFSSRGEGRFDLVGDRGTCYLAVTAAAAVRERLGEQFATSRLVAPEDAERMVVSRLELSEGIRTADLESPRIAEYPITSELTSMSDYDVPQAWARAFDGAGLDGVHYRGRFPYFESTSWAVFGQARPDTDRPVDPDPIDGFDACDQAGITVLPAPPTDLVGLTIIGR